jgi:imidazole glycerol phosphate synthase subunit HisF
MLKIRIIPVLLFKDRTIVKSYRFDELRMVGDPTTVARVFNERNADELLFLDIMASAVAKDQTSRSSATSPKNASCPSQSAGASAL